MKEEAAVARRARAARLEAARAGEEAKSLSSIQIQNAWRTRRCRLQCRLQLVMLAASGSAPIELVDWYKQESSEMDRCFIVAARVTDNTIIQTSRIVKEWTGEEGHFVLTSSGSIYKLLSKDAKHQSCIASKNAAGP